MNKKEEIILEACSALQEGGVNGFSFRDLADAVGVKSSSVHYYFKNKNELFAAILETFTAEFTQNLQDIVDQSSSLKEVIDGMIDTFVSIAQEQKFCVCGILAIDQKHLSEEMVDRVNETFCALRNWLAEVMATYPVPQHPRNELASVFISAIEGALMMDRLSSKTESLENLRSFMHRLLES
jgi:TetR/AcrR family transcriptional repressor of nem operon